MSEVSRNIKKFRIESGITQEALAEKMFVTRQTISNWENGKSQPDIETLKSLAEVFSVEITELIYGRKNTYPRFQKKYILTAAISLCVMIAVVILEITVYPAMKEYIRTTFTGVFELAVYDFSVKPLGFFSVGIFLLAALSLWVDIRMEKRVRKVLLIVGIVFLLPALWMLLETLLLHWFPQTFVIFILFSPLITSAVLRVICQLALPLLSGAALFLACNRRRENHQ